MSLEGLVVSLTILVIVGLWVAAPLVNRRLQQARADSDSQLRHERLLAQYDRLLASLRDLEEDNATGKFQPDDYMPEREQLIQRGVQLLAMMDTISLEKNPSSEKHMHLPKDDVDRAIEDAVASRRRKTASR